MSVEEQVVAPTPEPVVAAPVVDTTPVVEVTPQPEAEVNTPDVPEAPKPVSREQKMIDNLSFEDQLDDEDDDFEDTSGEEDDAPPPPKAVAPKPTPGQYDQDLIRDGQHYGFTESDLKEFGTPQAARKALAALDRRAAEFGRQAPKAEQTPPLKVEPTPAPEPQTGEDDADIAKLDLGLDPEVFDEQAIATLNRINDHYDALARKQNARIKASQDQNKAVQDRLVQEDSRRTVARLDNWFVNQADEDFQKVFGKGTVNTLTPDAPEVQARDAVVKEAMALIEADKKLGRDKLPLEKYLDKAKLLLHGDIIEQSTRKKLGEKVSRRGSQTVAAPTSRRTRERSPEKRAADRWNQARKDYGADEDTDEFADGI